VVGFESDEMVDEENDALNLPPNLLGPDAWRHTPVMYQRLTPVFGGHSYSK